MEIRKAVVSDIPDLLTLHEKWLFPNLREEDRGSGFLTCDKYSESDFNKMINADEVVVTFDGDRLVGYYLFDNYSNTNSLKLFQASIDKLLELGLFRTNRICRRAQAVIERDYQNSGLSKQMLQKLIEQIDGKYDVLFSIVYKNNPKLIAHQKAGWKILHEDSEKYFVQYVLTN